MNLSRLSRVTENMERRGLSQILVSAPPSIFYLTGLWVHPGERMLALVIDTSGACTLYANALFALSASAKGINLVEYSDTDDSVAVLSKGLKSGVLGLDRTWPSGFAIRLMNARSDIRLTDGSAPVDEARMLKDADEIERLAAASRLNDALVGELIGTLNPGQLETEVGRLYLDMALERGASGASFDPLICFGAACAEPHHISDRTAMRSGDSVILDLGATLGGYASDMTRTVFMHSATDEQKRVYELVLSANLRAIEAVRPGVPLSEIDRAARRVIEDGGYGDRFIHRTGHGIGIECHEPPDVSATSSAIALPGMVFSIEPGIYLPDRFGVRIEDLVLVTEDGCRVLNALGKDMIVL